ncbi:hypothetical protein D9757_000252 [Collybiopsis confluens]|uniref:Uncharacterized protein n=1 Tax=Collybiopsis confluens TaxID=2823264 RepID=A0A8H5I1P1_9AGAR|nr:hypothetical protein D9757_000252 [Collybiopsis confluens]
MSQSRRSHGTFSSTAHLLYTATFASIRRSCLAEMPISLPITSYFSSSARPKKNSKEGQSDAENARPKKKRKVDAGTSRSTRSSSSSGKRADGRTGKGEEEAPYSGTPNATPMPNRTRQQLANRTRSLNKAGFNAAIPSTPALNVGTGVSQATTAPRRAPYVTPKSLVRPSRTSGNATSAGSKALAPVIDLTVDEESQSRPISLAEPDDNPFVISSQRTKVSASILPPTPTSAVRPAVASSPFSSPLSSPFSSPLSSPPSSPKAINAALPTPSRSSIPTQFPRHVDSMSKTPESHSHPRNFTEGGSGSAPNVSQAPSSLNHAETDLSLFHQEIFPSASQDIVPSSQSQEIDSWSFDIVSPRRKLAAKEIFTSRRLATAHEAIDRQGSSTFPISISRQTSIAPDEVVPSSQSTIELDLFGYLRAKEDASGCHVAGDPRLLGQRKLLDSISPRRKRVAREVQDARRIAKEVEEKEHIDAKRYDMRNEDDNMDDVVPSSQSQEVDLSEYQSKSETNFSPLAENNGNMDGSRSDASRPLKSVQTKFNSINLVAGSNQGPFPETFRQTVAEIESLNEEDMQSLFVQNESQGVDENDGKERSRKGAEEEEEEEIVPIKLPFIPQDSVTGDESKGGQQAYRYSLGNDAATNLVLIQKERVLNHAASPFQSPSFSQSPRSQEDREPQSWQTDVSAYSFPPDATDFLDMLENGPD